MNKILEIISGADGKISSMRVSVFVVVISVVGVFLAHNILAMIKGQYVMVSMGWDQVTVLTTLLAAKAYQTKVEGTTYNGGSSQSPSQPVSNGEVP